MGTSLRNVLGHAKRLRIALRAAEPLCVLRNIPERSPRPAPGFPAFTALRSAGGEERGCEGYVSRLLFRALRERRITLGWVGNVVVAAADPHHKLPSAYLRERLLVLHLQLLFQGGVEFPTGGKSGGAKRRRGAGEASATEPMSPRPERVLVRMPAELVRSQYQRLESG